MICTFVRCFISMICFFVDKTLLFSAGACENPWRMMNLPLFKTFDRKFRNLLGLYCERHAFFPDHTCTREGEVGDKLWIMNSGPVMLQKKGFRVKMYSPGMHFGCDNMLGFLGCDGNVGFRVFYGKPLFFFWGHGCCSWILPWNPSTMPQFHLFRVTVITVITGWLDHIFLWTRKWRQKKRRLSRQYMGTMVAMTVCHVLSLSRFLEPHRRFFLWSATHWNPAVSSVTVTQMWDSTSSNLEMIGRFWYSKLSFFQIGLMSFDFLSFGADSVKEVFSMKIFQKKVSPTYMRWSNIHPRVLIKSWWSYKNVRPQSCGICWTVWRSVKADDVGDLRFWALGFPMGALFFWGGS